MQSWVLIPLLVLLVIGLVFLAFRFFWNLRTNKALVARLGEFVTLPSEQRAAERRKEVDQLLAADLRLTQPGDGGLLDERDPAADGEGDHDPSSTSSASAVAGCPVRRPTLRDGSASCAHAPS